VTVVSDPIPTIVSGVPVHLQRLDVAIDHPEFTLNPTSCQAMAVTSSLSSAQGAIVHPESHFQVGNCADLAFAPKLNISLKGSAQRGKNPALTAILTQPSGQANIGSVSVVLPRSEFIDPRHINNPCTRVQFNSGAGNGADCPAASILGTARAYTPLLEKPLEGPVYFRSNGGERELPDLVASLGGQIHVNLLGFIDSVRKKGTEVSRTRTRFNSVPDAPVTRFVLEMKGGKRGLLQNSANLCKVKNIATVKMNGQNGKAADSEVKVGNQCGKGKGKMAKKKAGAGKGA
jgi:hypothetical protein